MHASPWWEKLREQMPVVKKWAYFDHAGVGPLPGPTADVLIEFARDNAANGVADWVRWRTTVETARQLGARLIGADTNEIAIIHNTTEGINAVAEGFPWRPGDNLVTLSSEFPSNLYPWMNLADRGVETRQVSAHNERVDAAAIENAIDSRTRPVGRELGRLHDRLAKQSRRTGRNRPAAGSLLLCRCDPGARHVSAGCARNSNRRLGGRRSQVAARSGRCGPVLLAERAFRQIAADWRGLEQRAPLGRLHKHGPRSQDRCQPVRRGLALPGGDRRLCGKLAVCSSISARKRFLAICST